MLRFERPPRPKGFVRTVSPFAREVRKAIAKGMAPDFPEIWGQFKDQLCDAQRGKCGYCETFAMNHPAAVEHFAPKGDVHELLEEGSEASSLFNVRGRVTAPISATGYYWLAYAWDNWLLACERCNTGWKRSLFPVKEAPHPCPPAPDRPFTPLLLSPFGPLEPTEHLDFDSLGTIFPRGGSPQGEATIRTCGLHRESLRKAREGIAADAHRHIDRLLKAMAEEDPRTARNAVEDLLSLGSDPRAHAGMVRSIVRRKLKTSYSDLPVLAKKLAANAVKGSKRAGRRP